MTGRVAANAFAEQQRQWRSWLAGADAKARSFDAAWDAYKHIYRARSADEPPAPVWWPEDAPPRPPNIAALAAYAGTSSVAALHAWTIEHPQRFWEFTLNRWDVAFEHRPDKILQVDRGAEHATWLPGARYNISNACFHPQADAPAIVHASEADTTVRVVSRADLSALADRVAAGLRRLGLGPGDAVALYMPMNVQCVGAYLGIVRAGMIAVSIPDSFAPAEVAVRNRIAATKAMVTVGEFRRGGRPIRMYEKVVQAAAPQAVVLNLAADQSLRAGDVKWDDFLATDAVGPVLAGPEQTTNILFSSGTTGDPKAIPWTQLTPLKAAMDAHYHQDVRAGDVVAWPTNIGWMMGPWLIYGALINGATIALFDGLPTSGAFCRFVQDARVTMLGLVPALVRQWRKDNAVGGSDWSSIRVLSSTGEASNVQDYFWLMAQTEFRAPVIEYCGGTEIGGGHLTGTVLQPAAPATFTTPALGSEFVVLDERGAPVQAGHAGELFLVAPALGLSQRLLNQDHHDVYYAGCPVDPKGRTLRRHGDQVQRLGAGFWQAQGRADDTMNLGGIKVSSIELERVMNGHPDVGETAAVGVAPAGGGAQALVVFAVTDRQDLDTLRQELQDRNKTSLNPLFRVSDVVAVGSLPRTASNKVMRRTLRARYGSAAA